MSRKRKLSNVKERCRLCLADQGCMTNLFDEVLQSKVIDLSKSTSISIKDEYGLPNTICHICLYKLDMWNEFKEQFIRSNQMLLSQLELVETSDIENSKCKKTCIDLEPSGEDSLSDSFDKEKKSKAGIPPLIPLEFKNTECTVEQTMLKNIYISEDDVTSSKDSSQKTHDISDDEKCKNDEEQENKNVSELKPSLVPMKVRPLTGRRNRTTEQRKASTKRWVARKKALLEATGESVSDSDSIVSDDTQLSPVQKARIKTNMDKEVEKQKRLTRALQNLETNISDIIKANREDLISIDSDSDTHRTRSVKDINSDTSLIENKNSTVKKDIGQDEEKKVAFSEDTKEKENSLVLLSEKTVEEKLSKEDEIEITDNTFTPCSVKSELEIGDATYIVTSTLMLAEPHYLSKVNSNTSSKECNAGSVEQNSQEKNTDIIDAVQLRRVNPAPANTNDKKCIERCLNIEVEGTEIEALKRVQVELADFVEKEMKQRLFAINNDNLSKDKSGNACRNSHQTLDQQLKNIIEKTIKKNFESSMMRSCNSDLNLLAQQSGTVSPTFVKEAMNSKKYQPKVVLKRLDIVKESKIQNINNMHVVVKRTVKNKLGGPFSMVSHKRQSVPPIRYNDYNTSALDSDSYLSEEIDISESSRTESHTTQKLHENRKQSNVTNQVEEPKVVNASVAKNEQKIETQENIIKISSSHDDKYVCSVCEQSFNNRTDALTHIRMHKTETVSVSRHNKHKMMRCKRCHEIVEARFVKAHVCKSTKQQVHKCYVCNSTFRTEKVLVRHLESHDQSEFNIENITKGESKKLSNANVSQNSKDPVYIKSEKNKISKVDNNLLTKSDNSRVEISSVQMEKNGPTKVSGDMLEVKKPKETYTCFVCDKIFTDEEVLKDHLQKHCDDMSEDDQSPGKEQYQCAICGDSLDSEDALEAHVEKHLFDEEDDNPNLINIAHENEKSKEEPHHCLQCEETFNSEMLLEMHMQAHEEEAAIAEWERQGIKVYKYQCLICDELFEMEEDLSEHLGIHYPDVHVCQLCDKPFPSLEDLQKHVATH